jgi:hypothetical protein
VKGYLTMNRNRQVDSALPSHSSLRKRVTVWALIAMAAASIKLASVVTAAPVSISGIILLVGADESERVVNWYASSDTYQVVEVAPTARLRNGAFPNSARTYRAVVTANTVNGGFNGHAILDHLQENTEYSYHVRDYHGGWSPTYGFKTRRFDGNFDFLFFGDPQIGSSGDVPKDQAGWADTLKVALGANPDTELLVSGGDQVEVAGTEEQWTAFLAPDELRAYPWVPTIGNHDVGARAYEQHLWTPNTDRSPALYAGDTTQSGGDYWFIYKDVLFIDLNSNAYNTGAAGDSDQAHINFIADVVHRHGRKAKYTVLVYHHSIYSPADHANDTDNQKRRRDFPSAFSQLGVDLVLQGHDHNYSRSYLIDSGAKQNAGEQPGATRVFQDPGGVIYVTANSSSGSKYYPLSAPDITKDLYYGPDPLNPDHHWPNSVENQENVRSYVKVSVRDHALSVESIRSGTCNAPNAAYERGNVTWCGPDKGASPALPVGSHVDKVVIQPGPSSRRHEDRDREGHH